MAILRGTHGPAPRVWLSEFAALRLPTSDRLYPPFFAWVGFVSCLFLAFWIERQIWLAGLTVLAAGLVWHYLRRPHAVEKPGRSRK